MPDDDSWFFGPRNADLRRTTQYYIQRVYQRGGDLDPQGGVAVCRRFEQRAGWLNSTIGDPDWR